MPPARCTRSSPTARGRARTRDRRETLERTAAARQAAGVANLALPARARCRAHGRARHLESHRQGAVRASTQSASARCIHWEHGAAWDAGRDVERRAYLRPRAARDRQLDGGRARAAAALGLSRRACTYAATRCGRACVPLEPDGARRFPRGRDQARCRRAVVSRERAGDRRCMPSHSCAGCVRRSTSSCTSRVPGPSLRACVARWPTLGTRGARDVSRRRRRHGRVLR